MMMLHRVHVLRTLVNCPSNTVNNNTHVGYFNLQLATGVLEEVQLNRMLN